jgi:hypothetical protein
MRCELSPNEANNVESREDPHDNVKAPIARVAVLNLYTAT